MSSAASLNLGLSQNGILGNGLIEPAQRMSTAENSFTNRYSWREDEDWQEHICAKY